MKETYKPIARSLEYITLYGIVQAIVQHQDAEEILSIVDDIRNENDEWTLDGEAQHTLLPTFIVLKGIQKWVAKLPHTVLMRNAYTKAVETYTIDDTYLCDIGTASDL